MELVNPINLITSSIQFDVQRLSSIANNAANALTPGFKREFLSLDGEFNPYVSETSKSQPALTAVVDHKLGVQRQTSNPLDLAILGKGYFEVSTESGYAYTRQGSFKIDEKGRLVTSLGQPVSGKSGEIFLNDPNPSIDSKGQIVENGKVVDQIKVMSFDQEDMLAKIGGGLFIKTENTVMHEMDTPVLAQGSLESSNVDSTQEMVRLMETFRHFEISHKVIQAYDELNDKTLKNLSQF